MPIDDTTARHARRGPPSRLFDGGVLAGAALLHGLLFWIGGGIASGLGGSAQRRPWIGDEATYWAFAEQASRGATPAFDPFWPPLYGHFLRPFLALGEWAPVFVALIQILLLLLAALALRSLATRLFDSRDVGRWAWALLLLDPQLAAFCHFYWPEILHLALFLGATWVLVLRAGSWAWLTCAGVLLGAALLTKALLLPFVPLLLWPLVREIGWRRGIPRALLVAVVTTAVVAPTALRNLREHDGLVLASSARFNLWVGLTDVARHSADDRTADAFRQYVAGGRTHRERQAVVTEKLTALVREQSILDLTAAQLSKQYFRLFDKDSYLTDLLPGAPVPRDPHVYSDVAPAIATLLRGWSFAVYAVLLAAAGPGLTTTRLLGAPWLQVLWLFLAYNAVLFLGLHVKSRYRLQFLPVLALAAAATLSWIASAGPHRWRAVDGWQLGPWRLAGLRLGLGVALSAGLLALAFAGPLVR
jgi:hypothetical protein